MSFKPLVIFDCDGVLVDSEPVANRVLAQHLRAAGINMTDAEVQARFKGNSARQCQAIIGQWLGAPGTDELWRVMQAQTLVQLAGVQPVPGVTQVLAELQQAGLPFCVASAGDYEKMAITLGNTGLKARFGLSCFSAVDVPKSKPAPDLFLWAAAEMGVAPEHCLVVEDSVQGVQAAQAAGMAVCWYQPDAPQPATPDVWVFSDMAQLPAHILTWQEQFL
ncbi:HAD family phosphatase [Simiduia sp. 21SJ11W-1]|uniref:HAD family hydrolase n=1 Tax=Simiduia sp. 21SJ11W-1 TaxID=2909669 RepID=UPI00209F6133|nr:HAD family phosphatase [Simiduia sp. 21SJ11W-1]UTA48676.1 HAD family phosphatase [Simiduia sp. 21SJ11W-1]